jgi:F-type H+-transporting ATPase subunit gamma
MISTRDIKRKIKTIRNIQQMCRAMKTVSLVKLQKAEARLIAARPYAARMADSLARLASALGEESGAGTEKKAVIVIASDKGLCGGYNATVLRRATRETKGADIETIALGRKADRFLRRIGRNVIDSISPLGSEPNYTEAAALADRIAAKIKDGKIDQLEAIHGHFLRGTRSEIVTESLFPRAAENGGDVIMEPGPEELAKILMTRHLRAAIYAAELESSASEHGARVAAMSAASDNAEQIIEDLTMDYNRARQSAITKELSEIVGSAEALK